MLTAASSVWLHPKLWYRVIPVDGVTSTASFAPFPAEALSLVAWAQQDQRPQPCGHGGDAPCEACKVASASRATMWTALSKLLVAAVRAKALSVEEVVVALQHLRLGKLVSPQPPSEPQVSDEDAAIAARKGTIVLRAMRRACSVSAGDLVSVCSEMDSAIDQLSKKCDLNEGNDS